MRVFAIYQILLGRKTYEYSYETDELPNPRPTQPKKSSVESGIWSHFFPQQLIFRGVGIYFIYETDYKRNKPTQPNSANTRHVF